MEGVHGVITVYLIEIEIGTWNLSNESCEQVVSPHGYELMLHFKSTSNVFGCLHLPLRIVLFLAFVITWEKNQFH